jgi:hypothetical protein
MERRYLVAVLAVIATFAVTSHGFRALDRVSHGSDDQHLWLMSRLGRVAAEATAKCESSSAARAMAKVRTHLRPRYPEEAQLLAEMNVPFANLQSTIAGQMARQDAAIAHCARARAMAEAERAQRETVRMQQQVQQQMRQQMQQMTRYTKQANVAPMSFEVNLPADLDQRIQAQTASITAQVMAQVNDAKLQRLMAEKVRLNSMRISQVAVPDVPVPNLEVPVVDVTTDDGGHVITHVHTHVSCNVSHKSASQQ